MREHKIETSNSSSKGPDSFLDWFGGNRLPDSHRAGKPMATPDMRRSGGASVHSWIDDNGAWRNYRTFRTVVFCGLFGIYIGQYYIWTLGWL